MHDDNWRRAKELFCAALELEPSERERFFAAQFESIEVIAEARSLLATYLESPDFLEGVTASLLDDESDTVPALAGRRAGAWRLTREIGHGGMGVVWEAQRDDGQFEQRAAIKLLRASLFSDRDQRRFREERQILASLNHPCIARLLDGGMLEDGSPYLVMEYVDGEPIDLWCNRNRLDLRQRIELCLEVCAAVEYAHSQLIIHRDLKPANIFVTRDGSLKLLDFGIAMLIAQDEDPHDTATRLLTPECASPEQVRGERMSTATDVFALGVLFYKLFTGRHPFVENEANSLAALQAVCEREPRLPSSAAGAWRRELRGEMDAVVLQALRKNPADRYLTVQALAADLRAWLEGRAVSAVRQSWWRRSVKLIRRYKVQSAAIALAAASLLAGMIATSIEARHARQSEHEALAQKDHAQIAQHAAQADRDRAIAAQQAAIAAERAAAEDRNRANTEAMTARSINDFLENDLLAQANPSDQNSANGNPDPDLKVRTALDRAAERIHGKFSGQPLVEASIRQTIGETYIGLDLFQQGQPQLERVVELQRKTLGDNNPETLKSMASLARIYQYRSRYSQAEALFKRVLEAQRTQLGPGHPDTLSTAASFASFEYFMGRYPEAEARLRPVVDTLRRLYPGKREEFLEALSQLGDIDLEEGKYAEAESAVNEGLAIARKLHGDEHPDSIRLNQALERIYRATNRSQEAERVATPLVELFRSRYGAEHPDTLLFTSDLAGIYRAEGRFAEAAALLERTLEVSRRIAGNEDAYTLAYECYYIAALDSLGRFGEADRLASKNLETYRRVHGEEFNGAIAAALVYAAHERAMGRFGEAETVLTKLLPAIQKVRGPEHRDMANAMTSLGRVYQDEGKDDLAENTLAKALALDRKLPAGDLLLRECLTALARLRLAQQRYIEAEALLREATTGTGNQNAQLWDTFDRQSLLGASLLGQGKYAEAEPLLIAGYEGLKKLSPAISADANLPEAGQRLVRLYSAWGKPEKAGEWRLDLAPAENANQ
jgi:Tfp pilus assembly protein PilF